MALVTEKMARMRKLAEARGGGVLVVFGRGGGVWVIRALRGRELVSWFGFLVRVQDSVNVAKAQSSIHNF